MSDLFDKSWRSACRISPCSISDADQFIQAHYLAKRPAIILLCLLMLRCDTAVGCIVFSAPPREADVRYGGKTWELARLYIIDSVPKNAETCLKELFDIVESAERISFHNYDDGMLVDRIRTLKTKLKERNITL